MDHPEEGRQLNWAVLSGSIGMVAVLLERGADSNFGYGAPLRFAATRGSLPCVQLLLRAGALPNVDGSTSTALHCACESRSEACVRELLDAGADVDVNLDMDEMSGTPLTFAASSGSVVIVEMLLEAGADLHVCVPGFLQWTALHYACFNGHMEVTRMLLRHGARSKVEDTNGKTPIVLARESGFEEVAKLAEEWSQQQLITFLLGLEGASPSLARWSAHRIFDRNMLGEIFALLAPKQLETVGDA